MRWCQIFADVLGLPIHRDLQPVAVNTRGAGWIGAVGAKMIAFDDIPGMHRETAVFEPVASHKRVYDELFEVYQDLYKHLAPIYRRLNG